MAAALDCTRAAQPFKNATGLGGAEDFAVAGIEKEPMLALAELGSDVAGVLPAQFNEPLLAPLAMHHMDSCGPALGHLAVFDADVDRFVDPESAAPEQYDHGAVALGSRPSK
jgi:hypothetical protein